MSNILTSIGSIVEMSSRQHVKQGLINTWFQINKYNTKVTLTRVNIEKRDITGSAYVVGHPVLSEVGSAVSSDARVGAGAGAYTLVTNTTNPNNRNVTDIGVTQFAKWLAGETPIRLAHIAFGDGSTAYDSSDTALGNEDRRQGSPTYTQVSTGIVRVGVSISPDASSHTLREVGIFDAGAGGNMWARFVTDSNETISITEEVRIIF
jgi:hypothetical protein